VITVGWAIRGVHAPSSTGLWAPDVLFELCTDGRAPCPPATSRPGVVGTRRKGAALPTLR
jgi:hypothetical protein